MSAGVSPFQRTWTARAAWLATGVADRVCRRALDQGIIPKKSLRGEHLITLKVFASTEGFPTGPSAPSPELLRERMRVAASAVADCWFQGDASWVLIVSALDARISRSESLTLGLLQAYQGAELMVLPVGKWCADLKGAAST